MSAPRQIRRILVCTGLSGESVGGVLMARQLADLFRAELHVIHVIEPMDPNAEKAVPGLAETHMRQAREELDSFAKSHGLDETERHIARGEPEKEILSKRKELKADLVVMGRYGKGGLKRGVIGSIAHRVVRHNPVSTLIVQPEFRGMYRRIGVACDLDAGQHPELRRSLDVARLLGVKDVTMLHAYELPMGYHTILSEEQAHEKLRRLGTEQFEEAVNKVRTASDPEMTLKFAQGAPGRSIPTLAAELGIELLFMSTHHRTSDTFGALLGRTTEKILNAVDCSFWTETSPEMQHGIIDALKHLFD
ncbi:MAG: universal stress protein [Phycisphaeraceae bacterium]|nr:universal stress protein [Phycisphaeraceae bacterium]